MSTGRFEQSWLLGLDAGSNSIGWAAFLLDDTGRPIRLLDGGVRLFDWGRNPEKKSSLNRERGMKRRERRRRRARTWRRDELRKLLLSKFDLRAIAERPQPGDRPGKIWQQRAAATRHPIDRPTLAACLLHMSRHRGFKSARLAEQDEKTAREAQEEKNRWEASESALIDEMAKACVTNISQLFSRRIEDAKSARRDPIVRARRGQGDVPTRKLIRKDFADIRRTQQDHAGLAAHDWDKIEDLIFEQRPLRDPPRGRCSHFTEEPRLARAMPSAQRFLVRQTLCNLRVVESAFAESRMLTEQEFQRLVEILDAGGEHSWPSLRQAIGLNRRGAVFTIERQRRAGEKKRASKAVDGDATHALLADVIPDWATYAMAERDRIVANLTYSPL